MAQVPTFALYGEAGLPRDADVLHCETIQARSRLHDYRIDPHRHEHLFQTLFVAGGGGTAVLDGSAARLVPPCLVLVPPLVVHAYSFSHNVEGFVLTLHLPHVADILRACPEVLAGLSRPRVVALTGRAAAAAVAAGLAAVAGEFAGRAAGRRAMIEAQLAIVWLTAHRAELRPPEVTAAAHGRGIGHVIRLREMIDREFRTRLPVAAYARRLGVSPAHLRRLCRAHLGATPLDAVNARVVLEAKRLLVFTTLGVKQVAAEVGFDDHAYFSRFFQRQTGLAPTAFRALRSTMRQE